MSVDVPKMRITFSVKDSDIPKSSALTIEDVVTIEITAKVTSQYLRENGEIETTYEVESGNITKQGRSLRSARDKAEQDVGYQKLSTETAASGPFNNTV